MPLMLLAFAVLMVVGAADCLLLRAEWQQGLLAGSLSPLGVALDGLVGGYGWVAAVASLIVVLLSATVFTRLILRYSLSVIRSLLPLVLYGVWVLGSGFVPSLSLHLAGFMLIRSAGLMIHSFKREERFNDVMCASVYVILAALLVPDLVWTLLLLPVAWSTFRRTPREVLCSLLAMVAPLLVVSYVWWVPTGRVWTFLEGWYGGLTKLHLDPTALLAYVDAMGPTNVAMVALLVLLTLASVVVYVRSRGAMRLRARKVHVCFLLHFVVGVVLLLGGAPVATSVLLMAVGSVPLLHTFFVHCPGLPTALIYLLLLLVAVF